jgi:linoleoyl-CoA desaturase
VVTVETTVAAAPTRLAPAAGTKKQIVKFAPRGKESFHEVVKARVNDYFESNNISQHSNSKMVIKTIAMVSMYFVPYAFIVSGLGSISLIAFYALWAVMGLGIIGIGTSVMHDSNHGAYSENKTVNTMLGGLLNLLGGYAANWRIQHNILHHTYTNIEGLDEDIDPGPAIRMSPDKPLLKYHKYQHIYAWVLYTTMNLFWITTKDYKALFRYEKEGLLIKEKKTLRQALTELTLLKVLYLGYAIMLPLMFAGVAWYHVALGFVMMHMMAGFGLACIFQPAHVVETSDYSQPDDERKMENNWAVHQVMNTADFAPDNKLVSWFIGGLNFQIEHHLFPQICHVHYPAIAKIVKEVAEEHGIPYQVMPTFRNAVYEHGKMLYRLGQTERPEA